MDNLSIGSRSLKSGKINPASLLQEANKQLILTPPEPTTDSLDTITANYDNISVTSNERGDRDRDNRSVQSAMTVGSMLSTGENSGGTTHRLRGLAPAESSIETIERQIEQERERAASPSFSTYSKGSLLGKLYYI